METSTVLGDIIVRMEYLQAEDDLCEIGTRRNADGTTPIGIVSHPYVFQFVSFKF